MPDDVGATLARRPAVVAEILDGLTATPKTLPAKLFYDDAGCRLFERITELPSYYLTRAERRLLEGQGAAIVNAAPAETMVEYGAADEGKAELLLRHGTFSAYVPIDIAASNLRAIVARLARSRPALTVRPIEADFTRPITLPSSLAHRPCGFFPGSTIGNFEPDLVVSFLAGAARTLRSADGVARFIVGTDLRKEERRLLAAYDDPEGVTAAFNRNILLHVNRIADAEFDLRTFRHEARWHAGFGRIEMHLVSQRSQTIIVSGLPVRFESGESIHSESSYKHTRDGFLELAARGGWSGAGFWTDPAGLFGIHLLQAGAQ